MALLAHLWSFIWLRSLKVQPRFQWFAYLAHWYSLLTAGRCDLLSWASFWPDTSNHRSTDNSQSAAIGPEPVSWCLHQPRLFSPLPPESKTFLAVIVIKRLLHSRELNPCPVSWAGVLVLTGSPWLQSDTDAIRGSFDGVFTSLKPTAYLINAGLATTRHFRTTFAKRTQPRLDWARVGGVNVIVIESDYPIISSNPKLSHSPSLPLFIFLLVFHLSLVSISLWRLDLFPVCPRLCSSSLSVFSVEVHLHRLSLRGSPAALGQLQPLSVSARLSARQGPLLRLGQRGPGMCPHRPPPRVRRKPMWAYASTLYWIYISNGISMLSIYLF